VLPIDGVASGMWELGKPGKQAENRVESFAELTRQQREQPECRVARIAKFLDTKVVLTLGVLG
jgi:hypothetical protein